METVTITTLDGSGTATRIEKTTYDYDSKGNRVSALHEVDTDADGSVDETTKTEYLNDPYNFTGYSQVIQETEYDENGVITKRTIYALGHDVLSQTTTEYVAGVAQTPETFFFGYDGHGSTRVLFNMAGAIATVAGVEQIFFYDAYGNLLNMQIAQAATNLLYSGEQFDSKIGQQYLRARYYDATTGRFNRLDPFAGNNQDPQSLHKYLYTHGDPVNGIDPTGLATLTGAIAGITIGATLGSLALPILGTVYLSATGKVSFYNVFKQLGNPEVWLKATGGILAGSALSVVAQKALLTKIGKKAAAKFTPGLGLIMSIVGFVDSAKLTYQLVTEELPAENAEEYVATLIAGGLITAVAGKVIKNMAKKGVPNDQRYWSLTPEEQALYNRGQSILPSDIFNRLPDDPVKRGAILKRLFNEGQMAAVQTRGIFEAASNTVTGNGMNAFQWISSGLTPELRFIFSDNAATSFASVIASLHIGTDLLD